MRHTGDAPGSGAPRASGGRGGRDCGGGRGRGEGLGGGGEGVGAAGGAAEGGARPQQVGELRMRGGREQQGHVTHKMCDQVDERLHLENS